MAAELEGIVRVTRAIRYDGTNGEEAFNALNWTSSGWSFVSDMGGVLTVQHPMEGNRTFNMGDYLPHDRDGGAYAPFPNDSDFPDRWVKLSDL